MQGSNIVAQEFDILILGGGSAGYATALRARQLYYIQMALLKC